MTFEDFNTQLIDDLNGIEPDLDDIRYLYGLHPTEPWSVIVELAEGYLEDYEYVARCEARDEWERGDYYDYDYDY